MAQIKKSKKKDMERKLLNFYIPNSELYQFTKSNLGSRDDISLQGEMSTSELNEF